MKVKGVFSFFFFFCMLAMSLSSQRAIFSTVQCVFLVCGTLIWWNSTVSFWPFLFLWIHRATNLPPCFLPVKPNTSDSNRWKYIHDMCLLMPAEVWHFSWHSTGNKTTLAWLMHRHSEAAVNRGPALFTVVALCLSPPIYLNTLIRLKRSAVQLLLAADTKKSRVF